MKKTVLTQVLVILGVLAMFPALCFAQSGSATATTRTAKTAAATTTPTTSPTAAPTATTAPTPPTATTATDPATTILGYAAAVVGWLAVCVQQYLKQKKLKEAEEQRQLAEAAAAERERKLQKEKEEAETERTRQLEEAKKEAEEERKREVEKARQQADSEWAESMIMPVRLEPPAKRNSMILLGLGGTGKTMMIRQLLKDKRADPTRKTEHYWLYHGERSAGEAVNGRTVIYNLYISDYVGQDLGTLVRAFIAQQKERWSPMAYGYIGSLVLMVDLFSPPDHPADADKQKRTSIDRPRIVKHLSQWSEAALDAVFGLLTSGSLKYVCLFVNKSDLLLDQHQDAEKQAVAEFAPLQQELRRRALATGAIFETILGSAADGTGVPQLENALLQYSTSVALDRRRP